MALQIYTLATIEKWIKRRALEIKLGEKIDLLEQSDATQLETCLKNHSARFVLLGLPEDIGVRANYGRGGAHTAWGSVVAHLLNVQSNSFFSGQGLLLLGHVDFSDLMKRMDALDLTTTAGIDAARELTAEVDERVIPVIRAITSAGKIPIVIGGGHNNAYGNIKGSVEGLKSGGFLKKEGIHCINCDPHSDFRPLEGRHSGNGFSYAFDRGVLEKYAIIGLHQQYLSQKVYQELQHKKTQVHFSFFEEILNEGENAFLREVNKAIEFTKGNYTGIELDLDAIAGMACSAQTPTGITAEQARKYVQYTAQNVKVAYLHIAEGAPVLASPGSESMVGKLISYLVIDFMRTAK